MSFKDYFRDKFYYLIAAAAALILIFIFLFVFGVPPYAILYILLLLILVFGFWFFGEFKKRKKYYDTLLSSLDELDKKYLIAEITEPAPFADSEIFYSVLKQALKSMNDEIAARQLAVKNYKEYIENWVHEIKTPIAALRLTLENHTDQYSEPLASDLNKIESLVNNALYYARISVAEKDYIIKETTLDLIVKRTLKENSRLLISNRIAVEFDNLDLSVFTDIKWAGFILTQIILNSVKYKADDNPRIIFEGVQASERVVLKIKDNGIGIPSQDLPRVFDQGFTGDNGRKSANSTGMGLYICSKLCAKLGIEITVQIGEFTEFALIFPKTDFYLR